MPLPTWYRFIRALPGVIFGGMALTIGIYLLVTPTSYRDPSNQKLVDYANQMHFVVLIIGALVVLMGLFLLYFGASRFNKLPENLQDYSFEELRLSQAVAREVKHLTRDSRNTEFQLTDELKLKVSDWGKGRSWWGQGLFRFLLYGFGGHWVHVERVKSGYDVSGTLHVPVEWLLIYSQSGKTYRHEEVRQYDPSGHSLADNQEMDAAYYRFVRKMGLDHASAEELQVWLDQLRSV